MSLIGVEGIAWNHCAVSLSILSPYGRCSCHSELTSQSGPPVDRPVRSGAGLFRHPPSDSALPTRLRHCFPVPWCSCCCREMMNWELWRTGEPQNGEWGNAVSRWGGAEGEVLEAAWCILHASMWEPAAIFPVLWSPMWSLLINRPGTDLWMTLVCGIIYLENWEQDALCKNIFLVIFNMPNSKSPSFSNIFSILINLYLTFTYNLYLYLTMWRLSRHLTCWVALHFEAAA